MWQRGTLVKQLREHWTWSPEFWVGSSVFPLICWAQAIHSFIHLWVHLLILSCIRSCSHPFAHLSVLSLITLSKGICLLLPPPTPPSTSSPGKLFVGKLFDSEPISSSLGCLEDKEITWMKVTGSVWWHHVAAPNYTHHQTWALGLSGLWLLLASQRPRPSSRVRNVS